jgi:hypothetical protein
MRPYAPVLVALLASTAALATSCGASDGACYPTDWRACACDDSGAAGSGTGSSSGAGGGGGSGSGSGAGHTSGYQQCNAQGTAYGACDCSGVIPGLTTGGPPACTTNEECETGLCYPFSAKGPHCTMPCDSPSDCPPPWTGCNNMGVCKVP